jgi:hypothetical protein
LDRQGPYHALLAEAEAHGRATSSIADHLPPEWDGYYNSRTLLPVVVMGDI